MTRNMAGFASALVASHKLETISDGDHRAQGLRKCITVRQAEEWRELVDRVLGDMAL